MRDMTNTAPYAPGNAASREAAESVEHKLTGIRAEVFDFIVSRETIGATGSEIADALSLLPYTAKPRCTELRDAGYIRDSGLLRKNGNDRNETVWVACASWPKGVWKNPYSGLPPVEAAVEIRQSPFRDISTAAVGQRGLFWNPAWRCPYPGTVNGDFGAVWIDTCEPEARGWQAHATHWMEIVLPGGKVL